MSVEPQLRILRVLGKPLGRASQAKTVAPLIHIPAHPLLADIRQRPGEQNLQIAHGAFLRIVAARIGVEPGAPLGGHADEVRALMQHGMQRRVEARVDFRSDQAGLAFSPIRTRDDLLGRHQDQLQSVAIQKHP